ncbi:MAG: hypothetical protein Q7V31_15995 [Parvibaculum sp.]|uniref:hypothetical protein n=1 Tax=Parvibaculum sp. TaxID=2024848 RepID=UPI00271DF8EF|nr:hypothetical protein [Parvibaculum sp.]MDO8840415.1 hypothetical protein [Parvibaculum sp.]
MPEFAVLLREVLSTGGDAATIALVIALWRLDRRVFAIELGFAALEKLVVQLQTKGGK